ncbi:TetR family transcriptional regulator [Paenibacillus marchantiophytorum]
MIEWSNGYEVTSLNMLLQATGLSKSSFYDSFGSKHGAIFGNV